MNKMVSPQLPTIAQLSKAEGISEAMRFNWRKAPWQKEVNG